MNATRPSLLIVCELERLLSPPPTTTSYPSSLHRVHLISPLLLLVAPKSSGPSLYFQIFIRNINLKVTLKLQVPLSSEVRNYRLQCPVVALLVTSLPVLRPHIRYLPAWPLRISLPLPSWNSGDSGSGLRSVNSSSLSRPCSIWTMFLSWSVFLPGGRRQKRVALVCIASWLLLSE